MRLTVLPLMLIFGGLAAGPARAAADPCAVSWDDAPKDTVYNLGAASPAYQDDDLDAVHVTVRATLTQIVTTVRVTKLKADGPNLGTGHGLRVALSNSGKAIEAAARKDATYGDTSQVTGNAAVQLSLNAEANEFTLTFARSDLARHGDLTGLSVDTLRYDHVEHVLDTTPAGTGKVGASSDATKPAAGAKLSLDACDASRASTVLRLALTRSGDVCTITSTLTTKTGARLGKQLLRHFVAPDFYLFTLTTDSAGHTTMTIRGCHAAAGIQFIVRYDGMPGRYAAAKASVKT